MSEPLVQFAAVALLIFGIHWLVAPTEGVVVPESTEHALYDDFQEREGRAPSEDEAGLLRQAWLDEEVLFREGMALGLDRADPIVRRRIVQKMRYLTEGAEPQADDDALAAWLVAHSEEYALPARVSFRQVFASGPDAKAKIAAFELQIRSGARADELGQAFAHGHIMEQWTAPRVAAVFGAGFVAQLNAVPLERWAPVASSHGLHLVWVTERREPSQPTLGEVRAAVLRDWTADARAEQVDASMQRLRDRWLR